jgi:hypothetical protein
MAILLLLPALQKVLTSYPPAYQRKAEDRRMTIGLNRQEVEGDEMNKSISN